MAFRPPSGFKLLGPASMTYRAYEGPSTGGFNVLPQGIVPLPEQGIEERFTDAAPEFVAPKGFRLLSEPQRLAPPEPALPTAVPAPLGGVPSSGLTIVPKGGAPRLGTPAEAQALQMFAPFLEPRKPPVSVGDAVGRAMFNRGLRMVTHLPNLPGNVANLVVGADVVPPVVTAEPEEIRGAFTPGGAKAQFETSERYAQERPLATAVGEVGADVAALAALRQPALGPLKRRDIRLTEGLRKAEYVKQHFPEPIAKGWAEYKNKVINAPRFWGLTKGTTRIGEATAEGLMLGILNEQDPLTTAAMAGGGQALGSGILFLARPPAGTKYKTLNIGVKALAAGTLFHLLTGGYVLKDLETGFDKVKIGLGAAALAGLAGTGRLRSQNVTSVLPRVWDTIGSVPRHALISLASKYAASDAPTKKKIERAVQIMGADPTSETAQRLSRAMDAGGAAFIRVMDKIVPETVTP